MSEITSFDNHAIGEVLRKLGIEPTPEAIRQVIYARRKQVPWVCADCKRDTFFPMVILHDDLWLQIAEAKEILCFGCMGARVFKLLRRTIRQADLKPHSVTDGLLLGHVICSRDKREPTDG